MKSVLLAVMLLGVATPCLAKAYYAGRTEMIQKAEAIVIVTITGVEDTERKGSHWTYRQRAIASVERCLKGKLEGQIEIHGMETFICAQCRYQKGRFILFLRSDGELWVGSNWHLGIRPISGDKVEWPSGDERRFEMTEVPLSDVVVEISARVAEQRSGK